MKNWSFYAGRQLYIVVLLLVAVIQVYSQDETAKDLPQYLFREFSKSRVKMKSGKDIYSDFNYNTVTEKMVFQQGEQYLDLTNLESVDTVFLSDREFVPFAPVFYEVIVKGTVSFFIQQRSDLKPAGSPAAFGQTSEVNSSSYVSTVKSDNGQFNLKMPPNMTVKFSPVYWVRFNDQMFSFINQRQFLKIFPDKETEFKKFMKESRINVDRREDLIKLGNYCNVLMKN